MEGPPSASLNPEHGHGDGGVRPAPAHAEGRPGAHEGKRTSVLAGDPRVYSSQAESEEGAHLELEVVNLQAT